MALFQAATATIDKRGEPRDEVHFRARGIGADGRTLHLLVVNISARGLMARCSAPLGEDERLRVQLPVIGWADAQIRWSLGGRFGCELDAMIPLADYMMVLSAMVDQR